VCFSQTSQHSKPENESETTPMSATRSENPDYDYAWICEVDEQLSRPNLTVTPLLSIDATQCHTV